AGAEQLERALQHLLRQRGPGEQLPERQPAVACFSQEQGEPRLVVSFDERPQVLGGTSAMLGGRDRQHSSAGERGAAPRQRTKSAKDEALSGKPRHPFAEPKLSERALAGFKLVSVNQGDGTLHLCGAKMKQQLLALRQRCVDAGYER